MKPIFKISLFFIAVLLALLVSAHLWYLNSLNAVENYPDDTFLASEKNKKALIITAHDDDAFAMIGTVSKLISDGWEVRHLCFNSQWGGEEKDKLYTEIAKKQGLAGVEFLNIKYRNQQDSSSYMPIKVEKFGAVFNRQAVYNALVEKIEQFAPSVVFSLDDQIGGYGHPDHVFISKLVVDYFKENKNKNSVTIRRIYQGVYPPSMAEAINVKESLHNWSTVKPYVVAKEVYQVEGMPNPTTEINIYDWAKEKKTYMESFPQKDLRNIKKFAPAFHFYPYWLYFSIFDKEYFRVIE
jgi:N-acetylglucosamine malate deacetylase 2